MNITFIMRCSTFLFISTLCFMKDSTSAKIWIKNENISEFVTHKGTNYKVDALKVLFINEKGKKGPLYTLPLIELPLYQSIEKILPKDTYSKITVSLKLKKSADITHLCSIDKEHKISVSDKTTLHLGVSYEENGLECTLAYYEDPEMAP